MSHLLGAAKKFKTSADPAVKIAMRSCLVGFLAFFQLKVTTPKYLVLRAHRACLKKRHLRRMMVFEACKQRCRLEAGGYRHLSNGTYNILRNLWVIIVKKAGSYKYTDSNLIDQILISPDVVLHSFRGGTETALRMVQQRAHNVHISLRSSWVQNQVHIFCQFQFE